MSLKRLALVNALALGAVLSKLTGVPPVQPSLPKPKPLRKGNNGMHVYNGQHESWTERWKRHRRAWAPEGGGARECARRRAQIQSGKLTGYVPTPR